VVENEEEDTVAKLEEVVPCIHNTFLSFRPVRPAMPQSMSMPERGTCDKYSQQLHALFYKPDPVTGEGDEGPRTDGLVVNFTPEDGAPVSFGDANRATELDEDWPSLMARIPRDEDGNLLSAGSIYHDEGTCKPCVFFNSDKGKSCENGIYCRFCHFKHEPKKRQRLSKKKRLERRSREEGRTPDELQRNPMTAPLPVMIPLDE
jgi:hypothetical protein